MADDPGFGQPAMYLKTVGGEFARNQFCGARFVEGQLGMRVNIVTDGGEIGQKADVQKVHGC